MKKVVFFLLLIFIIVCGIGFFTNPSIDSDMNAINSYNEFTEEISNEPDTPKYVDTNPISVGIYDKNSAKNKRILIDEVTKPWTYHKDIIEYNVFYTQDKEIDASRIATCFDKYAGLYDEDVSKYRIGYNVQFTADGKDINKTIKSPKDVEEFYDYLEIYLYDGYHRAPGQWYSHTTEEEFNDNTLLLGIKLTAGKQVEKISSDITLTAFSYDSDDFDEAGNYRGISKYSITIHKQK